MTTSLESALQKGPPTKLQRIKLYKDIQKTKKQNVKLIEYFALTELASRELESPRPV